MGFTSDKGIKLTMQETPVSPGLAEGIVHVHRSLPGPIDGTEDIEQHNVEENSRVLMSRTPESRTFGSPSETHRMWPQALLSGRFGGVRAGEAGAHP